MNKHINKHKPVKVRADYGDTPVGVETLPVGRPIAVSLLDRIKVAASEEELRELHSLSDTYKTASEKTKRRWARAAQVRVAFLRAQKKAEA